MAVLQQSVEEARKGRKRTSTRTKKRAAARKAPVKKRAATKKSA
jgi:hypothetical protein